MLRDATHRDISVELFGKRLPAPVAIAPIGCQGIFHKDGETGTARGAAKLGLPYCMSTVSTRPLSQIAAASGSSPHWFQLYWPDSHELAESILSRVDQAGFDVLLLTVDTMMLGWRPKDVGDSYMPFAYGFCNGLIVEDPIFNKQNNLTPSQDFGPFPFDHVASAAKYHADLERLPEIRQLWKKPILLKGILHVEDALLALDAGVDGIVVSNHGARQLDGAVSSLTALARICEHPRIRAAQGSGKFTVLLDSGIRSGVDILKAITLGAKAVLIGRPCMYGLALAGEEGVESILRCLLADFETSLGLSGYKNIAEIWDKHDAVLIQDNT
ncbi:oxidoreductase [Auriculariales sp. MPI-PUGE-AT-0066]|nr:oxidoreductase [Auriculariales sp. MPI-PUGE-AT-0066]